MSQSPLARSTRKSLPAFAHPPSRLSKSTSIQNLKSDSDSPSPSPAKVNTPNNTPVNRYKNASSSTSTHTHTPSTPKILYSPYATSSPHAGPSRSASIPFDMAASARDARRKSLAPGSSIGREETPGMDEGEGDKEMVVMKGKRRAIMRKKPLFTRMKEYPQYLLDRFQYDIPSSILDILPPTHLANPIALGIHAIQYLLLAPILAGHDNGSVLKVGKAKGRWERFEDDSITRGRSMAGLWTGAGFTILILLLTLGNATYLFSRFKTYDMQLRSAQEPIKSPHASPIAAPRKKDKDVFDIVDDSESSTNEKGQMDGKKIAMMLGRAIWLTIKFIVAAAMSAIGKPTQSSSTFTGGVDDKIQSLRVWEPPSFCLAFFCAIPPTSPLLTYILTPLHPLLTPFIHLSTTFLLSHLATTYAQLVKDRQLLSAEVMREYDQRFVYRRVFASRVDRGTQTNEAELIW